MPVIPPDVVVEGAGRSGGGVADAVDLARDTLPSDDRTNRQFSEILLDGNDPDDGRGLATKRNHAFQSWRFSRLAR